MFRLTEDSLARQGALSMAEVAKAIRDLGVDPEKAFALCV